MNDTGPSSNQALNEAGIPDLTFPEPWQSGVIQDLNIIGNSISIACGMIVLTITAALRIYDKKLVDRVSLRLNAAVSATDVVNSMALLIYTFSNSEGASCTFSAFLIIWLSNQYIFLTTAIAFNLQWLFLHKRTLGSLEKWYFIGAIGTALVTAIIPLAAGKLGYDTAQTYCWYTPSYTAQVQGFEWGTYIVPQLICLAYCLVVVIIVAIKLKRDKRELDRHLQRPWIGRGWGNLPLHDVEVRQRKTQRSINRVVRRILLYPLVPIITQTGFIVSEIWMYQNLKASFPLNVWGVSLKALPGFFNLIAFSVDPAIYNVAITLVNDLIDKYGDVPKKSMTEGSSSGGQRQFDPTMTEMSLFEPNGTAKESDSTYVAPQVVEGNRFMRWIVRNWLQPSAGQRRNSLIEVSSSNHHEFDDETGIGFETKHLPNEILAEQDTNIPSPVSLIHTDQSNISDVSDRTRPLSQLSESYSPAAPDNSQHSPTRPTSTAVSDVLSPSSGPGGSTLHIPSTTDSIASPHRRRRHTNAGREMFHAL